MSIMSYGNQHTLSGIMVTNCVCACKHGTDIIKIMSNPLFLPANENIPRQNQ